MLSYRIQSQSPRPKRKERSVIHSPEEQKGLLQKNLSNCLFKVGDTVRFKKPRRNPVYGKIVAIDDKPEECTWASSGVPMNIHVSVPLKDKGTSIVYGHQIVRTNMKKLLYEGRK